MWRQSLIQICVVGNSCDLSSWTNTSFQFFSDFEYRILSNKKQDICTGSLWCNRQINKIWQNLILSFSNQENFPNSLLPFENGFWSFDTTTFLSFQYAKQLIHLKLLAWLLPSLAISGFLYSAVEPNKTLASWISPTPSSHCGRFGSLWHFPSTLSRFKESFHGFWYQILPRWSFQCHWYRSAVFCIQSRYPFTNSCTPSDSDPG